MLLDSPALICSVNYRDTVSVQPGVNGELEMVKIVSISHYNGSHLLLPRPCQSELIQKLGNSIKEAGQFREVGMGGIIVVHLPLDSSFDLETLLNSFGSTSVEIEEDVATSV
jgi:hypothetical protein